MYPAAIGMKAAITKSQTANTRPNILIPLSAFDAVNSTKYPMVTQIVAGMKLKKKHMSDLPWENALSATTHARYMRCRFFYACFAWRSAVIWSCANDLGTLATWLHKAR
jgi:hypothetical protein